MENTIASNEATSPKKSGQTAPGPRDKDSLRSLRREPLTFFLNLAQEYGDVSQFRAGFWPAYLINHPDFVQYVLRDSNRTFSKETFAYTMTANVFGESSLFITEGAFWRRIRRLVQPAFHRERIDQIGTIVTRRTQSTLDRLQRIIAAGKAFDIEEAMMIITVEIVAEALFGVDVSQRAKTIVEAVTTANVTMRPGFPKLRDNKLKDAIGVLDEAMYSIIAERREHGEDTGDLISMLLFSHDAETDEPLTDSQIRDQILTMLIPAEETSSTALSWTWYLLGQHPDIQEKLRQELKSVLNGRVPTISDLPKLQYTRMVFEEAMRIYPPIWIMSRKAIQDETIGGFHIPAGSFVALSPYAMHRHPDYWQNPDVFDPEHFSDAQIANRPQFAFYPFGGGPRGCIGESFARTESILILAMIAQQYHIELDPERPVEPDPAYTLRPANGVHVILRPVEV